ncbi:MAG: hypothetical protein J0I06_25025 [Planctomycetes bacterium]|nr:hypothetical protein [Planctomycetota bacterium]
MSDEATTGASEADMRLRLQQVAAYRELRQSVARSGRENVVYAALMLGFAYFIYSAGGNRDVALLFGALSAGELLVGLFKWVFPSAEGLLLDAFVLLAFAALNGWLAYSQFQQRGQPGLLAIFFGLYMLSGAFNRLKTYGDLRRLFAERPAPEHIAWFDDLVYEIRTSDPVTDRLALDLPTRPHWRAKLFGGTAFFVAATGHAVWVAGADDFTLRREKADRGTGHRKALLSIHGEQYPEFELGDTSWENYTKWLTSQRPAPPA